MGTLALSVGCAPARDVGGGHAEVHGVVRDRATGRAIAGARVIGADGALAETDGEGRFHLYVRSDRADVRVSAAGHSPERLEIAAGLDANVDLTPLEVDEGWVMHDEHVVSFVEERWVLDAAHALDAGATWADADGETARTHALELAHVGVIEGDVRATDCVACHAGAAPTARTSAHGLLGDGTARGTCLACHDAAGTEGDATRACVRCHGEPLSGRGPASRLAHDGDRPGATDPTRPRLHAPRFEGALPTGAMARGTAYDYVATARGGAGTATFEVGTGPPAPIAWTASTARAALRSREAHDPDWASALEGAPTR